MKKQKHILIVGVVLGSVSLNAFASSTAILSWAGLVGSGISDGDYMITGQNGSTTVDAFKGSLIGIESNAKFKSDHIVLEVRENTGSASAPVSGDKWGVGSELGGKPVAAINITWKVEHVAGTVGSGLDIASLNGGVNPIVVTINGTVVNESTSWSTVNQNEVGIRVENNTALDPNEVAGKDISVEVGISATAV